MYKLDRNSFKKQSFETVANYVDAYKNLSLTERLKISFYLNSIAYNFDINNPPRMDKTIFEAKKQN